MTRFDLSDIDRLSLAAIIEGRPRTIIYRNHIHWTEQGIWRGIFDALAQEYEFFINASIVKLHEGSSGAQKW